jgi:hypothetical protein
MQVEEQANPGSTLCENQAEISQPAQATKSRRSRAASQATADAKPDLSHIAEQLRPLAFPCSALTMDPANARRHPEPNLEAIKASLRVYGQRKPVVVNRRTGTIEAGNGTLQAALALGWSHLAVVYVDDDPMTAAGFSIADNRTAELAEWDREALDKLLVEIKTNDPVLDQMLADLGGLMGPVSSGLTDPDEVPEPPDEPITCPGDLWILGEHRLLCGDAGRPQRMERSPPAAYQAHSRISCSCQPQGPTTRTLRFDWPVSRRGSAMTRSWPTPAGEPWNLQRTHSFSGGGVTSCGSAACALRRTQPVKRPHWLSPAKPWNARYTKAIIPR